MKFNTIILEKNEAIGRIILNRPDVMNALTHEMVSELIAAQHEVAHDETIRVVVVTGKGRAFCSGADFTLISDLLKLSPKGVFEELRFIQDMATGFETLQKPVIAAVNGYALGGGLDIALACDFRIASNGAKMGEQYVKAGLMPDVGGTQRLPRLVGLAKAKEMILLGDMIDAEEAERIGLVTRVAPREALEQEVNALALKMASAPTTAIGLAKRSIHEGLCRDIRSGLELEALNQSLCMQTSDAKEGITAILEKRAPRFIGK
jgi:enoyl-CoA hydratase/carnithine racemase